MIAALALLVVAGGPGAGPAAITPATSVEGLLARCPRAADPVACAGPHLDLERYADRVLVDVARTATDAAALAALRAGLVARVEGRIRARWAAADAATHVGTCRVMGSRSASGVPRSASEGPRSASEGPRSAEARDPEAAAELRCGEHAVLMFGSMRGGRFVVDDLQVDGARVSRSHRAEVNKSARKLGLHLLAARLREGSRAAPSREPARLELGIGP